MRRLLMVSTVVFSLMVNPCFAIEYCKDFLESGNTGGWSASLKTFDEEWTMGVGDEIELDIWINDVPISLITAGFYIQYDPSKVSIVSVDVYDGNDLPGPWEGAFTTKIPDAGGSGTYMLAVGNFATAPPDGDGDIILGKVRFHCESEGHATISISTIPGVQTVVGDSTVFDGDIMANYVVIHQGEDICEGDFDGDLDQDGTDAALFKSDFGRSPYSRPCPTVTTTTTITTGGCPYGMVDCGTKCVDPMTDREYCGADSACLGGTACLAGEMCIAGVCENCGSGLSMCDQPDDCTYYTGDCCCTDGTNRVCQNETDCSQWGSCVTTIPTTTTSIVCPGLACRTGIDTTECVPEGSYCCQFDMVFWTIYPPECDFGHSRQVLPTCECECEVGSNSFIGRWPILEQEMANSWYPSPGYLFDFFPPFCEALPHNPVCGGICDETTDCGDGYCCGYATLQEFGSGDPYCTPQTSEAVCFFCNSDSDCAYSTSNTCCCSDCINLGYPSSMCMHPVSCEIASGCESECLVTTSTSTTSIPFTPCVSNLDCNAGECCALDGGVGSLGCQPISNETQCMCGSQSDCTYSTNNPCCCEDVIYNGTDTETLCVPSIACSLSGSTCLP